MHLTSTSDILRLVTASAVTVDVQASWDDYTTTTLTPGRTNTAITTATTTTIIGPPAASTQRRCNKLVIHNKHASSSNLVTVEHYDGTTAVRIARYTLLAGEQLEYGNGHWATFDANGRLKIGGGAGGGDALIADPLSQFAATSSAQLAGVISDETGSGLLVFGTSPTITTPAISGAMVLPDDVRQTFNPGTNNSGLNVGSLAGDPSSPSNGDAWYNSALNEFRVRAGSTTITVGSGGITLADIKDSCRVATTSAGTLATSFENGDTVDGVVLATGDRILIKNQASGAENGIYVVAASGAPSRSADANTDAEVTSGMFTFINEGAVNGNTGWALSTDDPITLDTTSLAFSKFTDPGNSANQNLSNLSSVAINTTLKSDTDNTDDLGEGAVRWRDIYSATLRTGTTAADTLKIQARDVDGTSWVDVLTVTAGNTPTSLMENTRHKPRVQTITSAATLTPNADADDIAEATAQAEPLTIAAPSGTPYNGQRIAIRLKDDGTGRALTLNAIYAAGGVALPTTTTASKLLRMLFMYNTMNSLNKWELLAKNEDA